MNSLGYRMDLKMNEEEIQRRAKSGDGRIRGKDRLPELRRNFEEAAPMPPSPIPVDPEPKPESEAEASIIGTGRLVPLTRRRLITSPQVWIGSSSSAATGYDPEDLTPSHIKSDLNALHRRVQKTPTTTTLLSSAPYVPPTATPMFLVAQDDLEYPESNADLEEERREKGNRREVQEAMLMMWGARSRLDCGGESTVKTRGIEAALNQIT
ncbi:hypothetical protein Tco_0630235 [Tanacetum coccineum]